MTDFARLVLDADTRGLKSGERDLKSVSRQSKQTASEVDGAANRMSLSFKRVGQAVAAAGAATALFQFGKASTQAAIDAQEMNSAFDVVFGDMAQGVREWAEVTGDALGRSTQEIQRGALAFQELFGRALQPEKAAELSKQFAVLTQDLASFKNLSNEVAQQKLFSGLVGEAEPLRAVGVFLNEAAVKAKAAELGLKGVNGQLTDQEKIVARAAIIQEQLATATGDVERTSESTANQIKSYNAAVEELQVAIGQKLLPVLTPLITGAAEVTTALANAVQGAESAGVTFNRLYNILTVAVGGWAAYRLALLAGAGASAIASSALVAQAGAIAAASARMGVFGTVTAAATVATRTLTGVLIANPFGAVAVAVGVLTAAMIGLGNAQRQARAETDNLVRSLRGLAQARSAEYSLQREKVRLEKSRVEARLAELQAEESRILASRSLPMGRGSLSTGSGLDRIRKEMQDLRWQVVEMEGELTAADNAFKKAGAAADSMVVPTAQAATGVGSLSKSLDDASRAASRASDEFADLMESLYPENITRRQREQLDLINKYADSIDNAYDARRRALGLAGTAELSDWITNGDPLADARRMVGQSAQGILDEMEKQAKGIDTVNVRIVESFQQMTDRALNSLDRFVRGIKGGGILDIVQGLLGALDAFGAIFTGGKGFNLLGAVFGKNPQGFYTGGSMTLGGNPGVDNNILSLNGSPIARVSNGERMSISPKNANAANDNRMNGTITVRLEKDGGLTAHVEGIAARVVGAAAPQLAAAGGRAGVAQVRRMQERSL